MRLDRERDKESKEREIGGIYNLSSLAHNYKSVVFLDSENDPELCIDSEKDYFISICTTYDTPHDYNWSVAQSRYVNDSQYELRTIIIIKFINTSEILTSKKWSG